MMLTTCPFDLYTVEKDKLGRVKYGIKSDGLKIPRGTFGHVASLKNNRMHTVYYEPMCTCTHH